MPKPKFVAEGTWGCYYHPRVACAGDRERAPGDLGSKVQVVSDFIRNELHVYRKIHASPRVRLYCVLPSTACLLRTDDELSAVSRCVRIFGKRAAEREAAQLGGLRRPDYLGVLDALDPATNGTTWINMQIPHVRGAMTVSRYIRSVPPSARWQDFVSLYQQASDAVRELVAQRVVHWDLHSSNLLVEPDTGTLRIIDFGLSIDVDSEASRRLIETRFGAQPLHPRFPLETQMLLLTHEVHRHSRKGARRAARDSERDEAQFIRYALSNTRWDTVFTPGFLERYVDGAIDFYAGYHLSDASGAPTASTALLWSGWSTWDNYALSILFVRSLCSMFDRVFPNRNTQFAAIVRVLMRNLHYDWRERLTADECVEAVRDAIGGGYTFGEHIEINQRPSYLLKCHALGEDVCSSDGSDGEHDEISPSPIASRASASATTKLWTNPKGVTE